MIHESYARLRNNINEVDDPKYQREDEHENKQCQCKEWDTRTAFTAKIGEKRSQNYLTRITETRRTRAETSL